MIVYTMRVALKNKRRKMSNAKDLKKFEHKHGTVVLSTVGSQFVITTTQRVRMDLVLATTSVRQNIVDALAKFDEHKECIKGWGHCVGDNTHLR